MFLSGLKTQPGGKVKADQRPCAGCGAHFITPPENGVHHPVRGIPDPLAMGGDERVQLRLGRARNLVERFFNKLKYYRRIATRYDKLGSSFLAMVKLASIRLRLRHYESTA